jgi:hypothetical protein
MAVGDPVQHPEFAGTVASVDTTGYWRDPSISPTSTGYHYNHNAETHMLVGDALGRAMIGLLGGEPSGDPVPDVVGMAQAAAEAAIVAAGFTVGTVTTDYSPTVPAGDVISQNPTAGTPMPAGSPVDIEVSLGILMVDVPDVVGQAQATAEANIVAAQLVVGAVTTAYSPTVPVGDVISQNPTGGASVPAGSSVDIEVSLGAEPSGDTVTITKAEYKSSRSEINIEATSSDGGSVTLTVVGYGDMTYDSRKNKFKYKVRPAANPGATITVTSSGGGQDTANVTQK